MRNGFDEITFEQLPDLPYLSTARIVRDYEDLTQSLADCTSGKVKVRPMIIKVIKAKIKEIKAEIDKRVAR